MRKPEIGNLVRTKDIHDKEHTGLVDWIGAMQFAYNDENGLRQIVLFQGSTEWEVIKVLSVS